MSRFSPPLTARMESRTISASSRLALESPRVFVLRIAPHVLFVRRIATTSRYASDVISNRCICLTLQPRSMNSSRKPIEQFGIAWAVRPSCRSYRVWQRCRGRNGDCQMRFTITRAVSGLSGETSHSASARRRPDVRPFAGAISVGGFAVGRYGEEARPHQRTAAVHVASNQEVRWRRVYRPGTRVKEASFDGFAS